jgi:hypothetical protein
MDPCAVLLQLGFAVEGSTAGLTGEIPTGGHLLHVHLSVLPQLGLGPELHATSLASKFLPEQRHVETTEGG